MFKKFVSILLSLALVLPIVSVQAYAATIDYNSNSRNNTTITVADEDGQRVTGAAITVTRSENTYEVSELGNGQYEFTRDGTNRRYTYTIVVSASGYETQTVTIRGNASNTTIELEASASTDPVTEISQFRVFYIADGTVPDSYSGSGAPEDYGPSANDTPLVLINVNLTMLREIAAQDNAPVVYHTGSAAASGNEWEFIPAGNRTDTDYLDKVQAFWTAVLSCVDEESIAAFEATGLYDEFMAYCLKSQSNGSMHCDGVLNVTPPVYVIELFQNNTYFGGGVTDSAVSSRFLTAYDILDQYEAT